MPTNPSPKIRGYFATLAWAAWLEYKRDRAGYLAVAMIYYAVVSLVPLLALFISALGLLLRFSSTAAEFEKQTMNSIEANLGAQLPATITLLLDTLQRQSIIGALISLAGLLIAASVLFRHLRLSFRAIWKYDPPLISGSMAVILRANILEFVIAVVMVLGVGGLLALGLALVAAAEWMSSLAGSYPVFSQTIAWSLALLGSFIIEAIAFALLFKVLPPVSIRWRYIWPTALLCAIAWVATGEALTLYGSLFGTRSAYGAIGGLLAILLWMKIVSQVLFFGAELCKVSVLRADEFRETKTPGPASNIQ